MFQQAGATAEGLSGLRPEELSENFQKMAEAAAKALGDDNTGGDFSAAISQTLRNLSEGAENLQVGGARDPVRGGKGRKKT